MLWSRFSAGLLGYQQFSEIHVNLRIWHLAGVGVSANVRFAPKNEPASVAFPLAGRALPANAPVVGVLSFNSAGPMMASRIDGFLRGLSELQYVADQNVAIEYRWAEFHDDRLPALADDLVRRQVAVIATFTRFTALAAKAATATIPIVFSVGDDPVKVGWSQA
jgi:ABC-type uncharacterized transport system substrate-binding protein